jgi:hypothetical protein
MLDPETKRLVEDVAAAGANVGDGRVAEHPRHHLEVLALFDRCRSAFGAVCLLADRGFGQEALILTRPLFTEALMMMELAAADEARRAELVVGWEMATLADLEGIWREAQARGDDLMPQLEACAKRRSQLEHYARRRGVGTREWRVDEKALAAKHGCDGYLDFRLAHHFVHGSAFAAGQRYSQRGDVVFIGGDAADAGWARAAALCGAQSLLYAVGAICMILGLDEPIELASLRQRLEKAAADVT